MKKAKQNRKHPHHAHMRHAMRTDAPLYLVRRSKIHGNGVYAAREIPKGTRIVEYLGERISHAQADARYEEKGQDDDRASRASLPYPHAPATGKGP